MLKHWIQLISSLLSCVAVSANTAAAQASAQISVSGGTATDQRGVRSNALSVAPAVSLSAAGSTSLRLGARATRFAAESWSLGMDAAFANRSALGRRAAFTLNGSAGGSRLQSSGSAAFAEASIIPAVEMRIGVVTLFGGARGARGYSSQASTAAALPFTPRAQATSTTRTGAGPLLGGLLTLASEAGTLQLGARADRMNVAGVGVTDRSVSMTGSQGRFSASLNAGTRSASDEHGSFASGAASLWVGAGLSLDVAAGRYPRDRMLGTPAGQYVNAGFSLRAGEPREPAPPVVRGAQPLSRGATRLAIRAPNARRVEIAGDFNEWQPKAATRAADGMWYADLMIPPGQYRYSFRIDGVEWRVPHGATAVDDGFGGKSAWLTVRDKPSQ